MKEALILLLVLMGLIPVEGRDDMTNIDESSILAHAIVLSSKQTGGFAENRLLEGDPRNLHSRLGRLKTVTSVVTSQWLTWNRSKSLPTDEESAWFFCCTRRAYTVGTTGATKMNHTGPTIATPIKNTNGIGRSLRIRRNCFFFAAPEELTRGTEGATKMNHTGPRKFHAC